MNKKTIKRRLEFAQRRKEHYHTVQFYDMLKAKGIEDPDEYLKELESTSWSEHELK